MGPEGLAEQAARIKKKGHPKVWQSEPRYGDKCKAYAMIMKAGHVGCKSRLLANCSSPLIIEDGV